MGNDNNDIWKDPPVSYWDEGVRFGTGWEMIAEIKTLRADLNAARAKLAKLPKTADGVEIVPGMVVYNAKGETSSVSFIVVCASEAKAGVVRTPDCDIYSTKESALAANDAAEGRVG